MNCLKCRVNPVAYYLDVCTACDDMEMYEACKLSLEAATLEKQAREIQAKWSKPQGKDGQGIESCCFVS